MKKKFWYGFGILVFVMAAVDLTKDGNWLAVAIAAVIICFLIYKGFGNPKSIKEGTQDTQPPKEKPAPDLPELPPVPNQLSDTADLSDPVDSSAPSDPIWKDTDGTNNLTVTIPVHEIVLDVPISKKYYADSGYRHNVIGPNLNVEEFTAFGIWLDGEDWMDYRNIEHLTAIKYRNGKAVEAFDTNINTKRTNPRYAAKFPEAPTFKEIVGDFDNFVGDDTIVAYRLEEQCEYLFNEGSRIMKNKGKKIDIFTEAQKIVEMDSYASMLESLGEFKELREYKNSEYYEEPGEEKYLFRNLMDHYGIADIQDTVDYVIATAVIFMGLVYDKLSKTR